MPNPPKSCNDAILRVDRYGKPHEWECMYLYINVHPSADRLPNLLPSLLFLPILPFADCAESVSGKTEMITIPSATSLRPKLQSYSWP